MNYSVSHHLREPGVKQRDGVMRTGSVPPKFLLIALHVINNIHFLYQQKALLKNICFGVRFILEMKHHRGLLFTHPYRVKDYNALAKFLHHEPLGQIFIPQKQGIVPFLVYRWLLSRS